MASACPGPPGRASVAGGPGADARRPLARAGRGGGGGGGGLDGKGGGPPPGLTECGRRGAGLGLGRRGRGARDRGPPGVAVDLRARRPRARPPLCRCDPARLPPRAPGRDPRLRWRRRQRPGLRGAGPGLLRPPPSVLNDAFLLGELLPVGSEQEVSSGGPFLKPPAGLGGPR